MRDSVALTRRSVIAAGALGAFATITGTVAAGKSPKKQPIKKQPTPPSTRAALRRVDLMLETIRSIQGRLEGCESDTCATVLEHSFARMDYTRAARDAISKADAKRARTNLLSVHDIVEGDIALLEAVPDRGSVGDVLALERALLNQTNAALDAVDRLGVMPGDNPNF